MLRRLPLPLHLLFVVASSLCAQDSEVSLCIVEAKLHPEIQYDPPAGPLAIDIYKHLAGKKLADGSPLKITVLPASGEKELLPWIARLRCSWVLQLWRTNRDQLSYQSPVVTYDDVYFSLWNGSTRKAVAKGTALFPRTRNSLSHVSKATNPAAELAEQVINRLSKPH